MVASKSATADIEKAMKDVKMNPFEACKQVGLRLLNPFSLATRKQFFVPLQEFKKIVSDLNS